MPKGLLSEELKFVPISAAIDVNGAAENDGDSVNMRDFHNATYIIYTGTMATADAYVKFYSGATAGTKTSACAFRYAFGGAAIGTAVAGSASSCDVLGAWTTAVAATGAAITNATYDDYMMVCEVDAAQMDMANGEEWLTITLADTDTGATGTCEVFAVLRPRYTQNRSVTCLA
jgi:hypothetical protein